MLTLINSNVADDKDVAVAGFVTSPQKGDRSSSSQRCLLSTLDMHSFFLHKKL